MYCGRARIVVLGFDVLRLKPVAHITVTDSQSYYSKARDLFLSHGLMITLWGLRPLGFRP